MLIALLPTGGMTLAYTGITNGNLAAAIRISIFSLVLSAFLAPLYLYFLMRESIDIDFYLIIQKILLIILVPFILGVITRYFVEK
jgi:predicted Na+-dependent transporter